MSTASYNIPADFTPTQQRVTWIDDRGQTHTADVYSPSVAAQKWDGVDAHLAILLPGVSEAMVRAIFSYVKINVLGTHEGQSPVFLTFVDEEGDRSTVAAVLTRGV